MNESVKRPLNVSTPLLNRDQAKHEPRQKSCAELTSGVGELARMRVEAGGDNGRGAKKSSLFGGSKQRVHLPNSPSATAARSPRATPGRQRTSGPPKGDEQRASTSTRGGESWRPIHIVAVPNEKRRKTVRILPERGSSARARGGRSPTGEAARRTSGCNLQNKSSALTS